MNINSEENAVVLFYLKIYVAKFTYHIVFEREIYCWNKKC